MIAEKEEEMKETSFGIGQKGTWFWKGNQVYIICPFFETVVILLMQKTSRELGTDTVFCIQDIPGIQHHHQIGISCTSSDGCWFCHSLNKQRSFEAY